MNDDLPTFDELREQRENHLLGRDKPRRPNERDELRAAVNYLNDADRDPDAGVRDYIDFDDWPDERPRHTNERALLSAEREAQEALKAEQAEKQQREESAAELEREWEPRKAAAWTQDETQKLQHYEQRVQTFNDKLQEYNRFIKEHPDHLSVEQRQRAEQALAEEKQTLDQAAQQIQQAAQTKRVAGLRAQLPKELNDADTKRAFIKWAEDQGIHRSLVTSSQNPAELSVLFKRYKDEQKELERNRKNRDLAAWGKKNFSRRAGLPQPESVEQAHERLKQSGSMEDAARLLTMKKVANLI